jgi:hypothetical protein
MCYSFVAWRPRNYAGLPRNADNENLGDGTTAIKSDIIGLRGDSARLRASNRRITRRSAAALQ